MKDSETQKAIKEFVDEIYLSKDERVKTEFYTILALIMAFAVVNYFRRFYESTIKRKT